MIRVGERERWQGANLASLSPSNTGRQSLPHPHCQTVKLAHCQTIKLSSLKTVQELS